jgi:hypothetical protein
MSISFAILAFDALRVCNQTKMSWKSRHVPTMPISW